ncbi:MAG: diguanylate cyclase [Paraglaciecola sp.]|uniref:GGDEF domain-containing protein n=1 Tax=Paraglaciecola sp. TaxID=1920173 RepID=UPI003297705E
MNIQRIILNYLSTGIRIHHSLESKQQVLVANLFGFIGYSLTLLLGISAWAREEFNLAIILSIASALFFTSHLLLHLKSLANPYKYSAILLTSSLMLLMMYLVYSGGNNNTGPLWIYLVPPVALFFGGLVKGSIHLAIFVLITSFLLFFENGELLISTYSYEFKSRLIYSFLTVSGLFAFYEYTRQYSFRRIKEMSDTFEQQAMQDPLTAILNRRGMYEKLKQEFSRSKRAKSVVTVMMADIDHFKSINDQFGHNTGDEIIQSLASDFVRALRKQDVVGRWGGEEYLFLLPDTKGEDALLLAEKLRKRIESMRFKHEDKDFGATVSIGVHQVTEQDSINQAISKADQCLYQAKVAGRNRCILG